MNKMSFNHIVIQNILRDIGTYISFFLSSVFSVLVFFLFLIVGFHPMMSSVDPDSSIGLMMIFSSFIVYIFSFLFIIYSMLAFLKKKTKSLGIFMISGASMKQVRLMIFRENMLMGIASIVTAITIGLISAPLFLMGVKNILQVNDFGMYLPIVPILITLVLFSLLFYIVSKFITRFIKTEEAIELLKSDITQEKPISRAPWKLTLSILGSLSLLVLYAIIPRVVESFGLIYYIVLFMSLFFAIYFIITHSILFFIHKSQRKSSYYKRTNMLFVSNLQAKGYSYANVIYLLCLLLVAVFVSTSVLYSSYHNVAEDTEALYPYSFQYISLPGNSSDQEKDDNEFIEETLQQTGEKYESFQSEFKTDEERRIGFISNSKFNLLGTHQDIELAENEYYVIAGNEGIVPDEKIIEDYIGEELHFKGLDEQMMLTTGLRRQYIVVPVSMYESMSYPVYNVFAYELEDWTEQIEVAEKIAEQVYIQTEKRLVTSKILLYDSQLFIRSILFFLGFMLSLIFLSAAMSILYFYLQTSLAEEKDKYSRIRKIGLSIKEIDVIVKKELAILIFVPFTLATILLFTTLFSIRDLLSKAFLQVTMLGVGVFLILFILSFFIIHRTYLKKLIE